MVLVDTSVWIRFLSGQMPYAQELDRLLGVDDVAAHELVYGELLIGDLGGRREMLASYAKIYLAANVPHREVVRFVHARNLNGRGVGWTDIHLLASALVGRLRFWTANSRSAALAEELGVRYEMPA